MALRWGYLGAGGIADLIAADFQIAGLKIQAVATRDMERTNAFADKFNIPNRHPDYASLVADPEVDVVYISTVQTLHREHTLLAIAAGKHVLLEKPFTMNAADAHAIYDAAKAKGVFVMEAMWTRFLPTMDEGAFVLDYFLPAGTSLAVTEDFARKIEEELKRTPEVRSFSRRTGADRSRSSEQVIADLRERIGHGYPEVRIEFVQVLQDVLNDLAGNPRPIEIKLFGPDYAKLHEVGG